MFFTITKKYLVLLSLPLGDVTILITQLSFSMPFSIFFCTEIKTEQSGTKLMQSTIVDFWGFFNLNLGRSSTFLVNEDSSMQN